MCNSGCAPHGDRDTSFGANVAVGSGVQRLAAAVSRGHGRSQEQGAGLPIHGQIHPCRQTPAASPRGLADGQRCEVGGYQRGGAGSVHAHAGPLHSHTDISGRKQVALTSIS